MSHIDYYHSPVGILRFESNGSGLTRLALVGKTNDDVNPDAVTKLCKQQLHEYFEETRTEFVLPYAIETGTPLMRSVWEALRQIPYGHTLSYAELAQRVGNPKAVRAVGTAVGRNPLPILIPCHRIIRSDGQTGQFLFGPEVKRRLLLLEGARTGGILLSPKFEEE